MIIFPLLQGDVHLYCRLCNKHFHGSSRSSVLLLAPLLAEADPAPRRVSRPTGSAGAQGTDGLCAHFRWMADHVPAFRVPGTHIHVLTSPDQFYQSMKVSVTVQFLQLSSWCLWRGGLRYFPCSVSLFVSEDQLTAAPTCCSKTSLSLHFAVKTGF